MAVQQTVVAYEESWRRFLVGRSPAMERLAEKIRLIGPKKATVMITGETGTGKEVTARAIHAASPRAHLPLVAVNCTALPDALLEAELFGHVRGAFTGAVQGRVGRFEQANRSTIFLDEIGDMPMDTQAKLLRVLQEREFQRLGSSETIRVDVRVVAATNGNLLEKIAAGKFREDLYYRLNVVPLQLPALRDRAADIPALAAYFAERVCLQEGVPVRQFAPETIEMLCACSWPGNVRQLENAVENAVAMSGERMMLLPGDFALPAAAGKRVVEEDSGGIFTLPDDGLDFEETVARIEMRLLDQALRRTNGNKTQAAEILRLKRTTLSAKLRALARYAPPIYGGSPECHPCQM